MDFVSIGFDRVLTEAVGPGWFRGQLGIAVEIVPLLFVSQESATYAAGFNVLGRHYLTRRRALRPFINLGAGMLFSEEAIPENSASLNFTPQVGIGFALEDAGNRMYSFELRYHHLSNGDRVHPNPGINFGVIQFGILFP
jgi:hypothetical protein